MPQVPLTTQDACPSATVHSSLHAESGWGTHTPHVSHRPSLSFACRYDRSTAEEATAPAQHPAFPPRRWAVTTVHPVYCWLALPIYHSGAPDASGKALAMARIYLSSTYSDLETGAVRLP